MRRKSYKETKPTVLANAFLAPITQLYFVPFACKTDSGSISKILNAPISVCVAVIAIWPGPRTRLESTQSLVPSVVFTLKLVEDI